MGFKDQILQFDIDSYINPYLPPNLVQRLPRPISHWLGYRDKKQQDPPALISHLWAFTGSFAGLLAVGAIYKYAPGINQFHPPVLIASFGASAILEYGAIYSPLAHPRNTLIGHTISAVIGVAISKAFQGFADFSDIQWVAGALACAIAMLAMLLTNTLHPPGGATAVIACVDAPAIAMGWWFVPVIMVAICVMLGVSLINNNVMRQYPLYWWTGSETGTKLRRKQQRDEEEHEQNEKHEENEKHDTKSESTLHPVDSNSNISHDAWVDRIVIQEHHITLPADLVTSEAELAVLKALQQRLLKPLE